MKWAIIGTGKISTQFANDSSLVDDVQIVAVVSRTEMSGKAFAQKFDIPKVYTDYETLLNKEQIDNVYIGVPHTSHMDAANFFLSRGKNVLCEKPLGINQKQVKGMIQTAKENKCLLMEAMWTLFFPAVIKVKELVNSKHYGRINSISGYFGYGTGETRDRWRYYNDMAGGALLDIGIYPLHFYLYLFDSLPKKYTGYAQIENDVDVEEKVIFDFNSVVAGFDASIYHTLSNQYDIYCDHGSIHLSPISNPNQIILQPDDGDREIMDYCYEKQGMQYQIAAFEKAAQQGLKECPPVTFEKTLDAVKIMDSLRKEWNLIYPQDV